MSAKQHFKTAQKAFERLERLAATPVTYWPRLQESEPLKSIPAYGASTLVEQIDKNLRLAGKTSADLRPGVSSTEMDAALKAARQMDLSKLQALGRPSAELRDSSSAISAPDAPAPTRSQSFDSLFAADLRNGFFGPPLRFPRLTK